MFFNPGTFGFSPQGIKFSRVDLRVFSKGFTDGLRGQGYVGDVETKGVLFVPGLQGR